MNEKHVGISQQTLISSAEDQVVPSKQFPQYVATLAAALGSLAAGMTLAWSSSARNEHFLGSSYDIQISEIEFSWISSLLAIGSAVICIPIGILANIIGRKYTMLSMVIPYSIGWLLIIFANSVMMFYIGRFATGVASGAFCILPQMYTAEIAHNEIRGILEISIHLLAAVGMLLSYSIGAYNIHVLSIVSAIVPLIFFGVFMFMPETPLYYLKKGDENSARKSLIKLRGARYNIEDEIQSHKNTLEENNRTAALFWTSIKSRAALNGCIIAYGLLYFQQLSGVNVVIFYTTAIFEKAGTNLEPAYSTIVVGAMQVVAAFISALIVDRLGRRVLLLASIIFLGLGTFALGVYFYLSENAVNVDSINWLPLVSACVFIIMFNMGFGPLPWSMTSEIFAPEVKSVLAGSAGLFNWVLVFIVTKFFQELSDAITLGATFWVFTLNSLIGAFFVYFLVPETKGKSLEQIQKELSSS